MSIYEWKLRWLPPWKDNAHVYIHKKQKNHETFLYKKSQTFLKKLDNCHYVFIYKKPYTWRYGIFMKFLKLAFIYKKHDILRYVTFLYTKARHFAKSKKMFDTFSDTKIWHFCVTRFFIEFLKIAEGGGTFIFIKKQYTLRDIFILKKQCTLRYVAIYKESDIMR